MIIFTNVSPNFVTCATTGSVIILPYMIFLATRRYWQHSRLFFSGRPHNVQLVCSRQLQSYVSSLIHYFILGLHKLKIVGTCKVRTSKLAPNFKSQPDKKVLTSWKGGKRKISFPSSKIVRTYRRILVPTSFLYRNFKKSALFCLK